MGNKKIGNDSKFKEIIRELKKIEGCHIGYAMKCVIADKIHKGLNSKKCIVEFTKNLDVSEAQTNSYRFYEVSYENQFTICIQCLDYYDGTDKDSHKVRVLKAWVM